MDKYHLLIKYIKEWGFLLAFEHYFYGMELRFFSQTRLRKMRERLMYKKINIIKNEYQEIIRELNKKYVSYNPEKNEVIWQYWSGESKPKLIDLCMKSVVKHSNFKVIELNDNNLSKYYIASKSVKEKKDLCITKTHFSDILRVNLLYRYGGAWLDSTIMFSKDQSKLFERDFWTIKKESLNSITRGMWSSYAMATRKGNKLMYYLSNLFDIYWETHETMIDYFLIDIFIYILYCEDEEIKCMINNVPINNIFSADLEKVINTNIDNIPNGFYDTGIFKLSWKNEKNERINGKETLFRKLLNEYGIE